jgi:hypothetical protein
MLAEIGRASRTAPAAAVLAQDPDAQPRRSKSTARRFTTDLAARNYYKIPRRVLDGLPRPRAGMRCARRSRPGQHGFLPTVHLPPTECSVSAWPAALLARRRTCSHSSVPDRYHFHDRRIATSHAVPSMIATM